MSRAVNLKTVTLFAVVSACALESAALADDPKFEFGKQEEVKDVKAVEWKAAAQAGFILTSGNSRTTTLSFGANASRKSGDNKFSLDGMVSYGQSDIRIAVDDDAPGDPGAGLVGPDEIITQSTVTTNAWLVKARYDRFLTEKNSLFVTARLGGDAVAGKTIIAGGQLGYSRLLLKTGMHELAGEIGYDFSYESYEAADVDALSIHSSRLFLGYTGTLTADTQLTAAIEWLANLNAEDDAPNDDNGDGNAADDPLGVDAFKDNRVTAKVALTTKITADISFRFGFTAKLDAAPAPLPNVAGSAGYEAGFQPVAEELDTITEAQLIINLI
jgi:hypothetical protein